MKRMVCFALSFLVMASGCTGPTGSSVSDGNSAPTVSGGQRDPIRRPAVGESVVIDPSYDFAPEEMLPSDFGNHFLNCDYPTQVSTYKIGEGTDVENEVTVLKGAQEGPTIYVVAGVHGDEQAGWETGNQLKKIGIKAGTLYILSPANRWGANAQPRSRYIDGIYDLNRSFPGRSDGNIGERAAHPIYQDIKRVDPVFLFDLHEAQSNRENYDFLGSSLIYTSLDKMSDLYLDLLLATQTGQVGSERFNFFAPGPIGSLNNTITTNLKIPTITVETYRGYPLERRIGDQLDIVEYVLNYYGML